MKAKQKQKPKTKPESDFGIWESHQNERTIVQLQFWDYYDGTNLQKSNGDQGRFVHNESHHGDVVSLATEPQSTSGAKFLVSPWVETLGKGLTSVLFSLRISVENKPKSLV